ncbi:Hypothetical protein, putative [Bodo saltans]|uniref:Uncharacterized protein n=1 Tax=Bodo saltans TaxID=75058 RepID=A0A0S4J294_BODSA|nr:Hypothetical protein, putative [Bodo saltans]|eukprot:CUG18802.1 Hypothetical protein, putative [Bodo saltans]
MLLEQLMHADTRHRATMKVTIQRMQQLLDAALKGAESKPQPTLSVGSCSLPPGWLDSVDQQSSLLDAVLCLVGCPLPVDRIDLHKYHTDLSEPVLRSWYQH